MSGLNAIIGGLGGNQEGYEPWRRQLEADTGRRTIVIRSQRFGDPSTPDVTDYPDELERQARHVKDVLDKASYSGALHIYLHSMGVPIGLIFAKGYRGQHNIAKVVAVAPANLYAEEFVEAGVHIARKIASDLRSPEGRNYWLHSLPEYFINPFRALEEGYEVSTEPVAGPLMRELRYEGILLLVGVSPDDEVFPLRLVQRALDHMGIPYFILSRGSRHSPDFNPERLNGDLRDNGAL